MNTEQLQERLAAAEQRLAALTQREQAVQAERLRQEGAVLTLRILIVETQATTEQAEQSEGGTENG